MKELLTYIVQSLVDHPDEVSVTERKVDGETILEVRVADGDIGKVIGRQGRIVKQEPRGFSRGVAGFSNYDREFRMPLVLAQGSPIFHSSCEGKLGIALE